MTNIELAKDSYGGDVICKLPEVYGIREYKKNKLMRARLAKKIVNASPLYKWYCNLFGKKPCKNKYWLQKWEIRQRGKVFHHKGKADYRLLVASRKADAYSRSIFYKIKSRRKLIQK